MNAEFCKIKEEGYQKKKMEAFSQENEDLRNLAEHLVRRIRLLSEYNSTGIDKIIASKVEKENCKKFLIFD